MKINAQQKFLRALHNQTDITLYIHTVHRQRLILAVSWLTYYDSW